MNKEIINKDWMTFSNWERKYKKKFLRDLTIESAFKIFSELWDMQKRLLTPEEIELLRKRKLDELIKLRKSFDLIQKSMEQKEHGRKNNHPNPA